MRLSGINTFVQGIRIKNKNVSAQTGMNFLNRDSFDKFESNKCLSATNSLSFGLSIRNTSYTTLKKDLKAYFEQNGKEYDTAERLIIYRRLEEGRRHANDYLELNETQKQACLEGVCEGLHLLCALDYSKLDETQRTAYWEGTDNHGFAHMTAYEYAQLHPEQRENVEKLLDENNRLPYGVADRLGKAYSELDPARRDAYWDGVSRGFEYFTAIGYANLSESQREVAVQKLSEGFESYDAIDYARLDEAQKK